ncbi:MAG TPA: hypothetical protein VI389_00880, partial [Geobacteraceae bacterium]
MTSLALVVAGVLQFLNREELATKLQTAYPLYSHEFFSSLDGPLLPLRDAGLRQNFISPDSVLYGISVWLSPGLQGEERTVVLTLNGARGEELRQVIKNIDRESFHTFIFDPLENVAGQSFSFTLAVAGGSPTPSVMTKMSDASAPTGGTLVGNGILQGKVLSHATLHPALCNTAKLRVFLNAVKVPLFILIALVGLVSFRFVSVRAIYPVLLLAGLYTTLVFTPYSKVDEDAHFDYINAIYREHRLPVISQGYHTADLLTLSREMGDPLFKLNYAWFGKRYIAVHPPLYYLVGSGGAALVSIFTKSVAIRFFLLRFMGVLLSLLTAFFVIKTYGFLVEHSKIRRNDLLLLGVMMVLFLSPGYQSALIPLNNDQLTVPLASLFLFLVTKAVCSDSVDGRGMVLLALLAALLFLTKVTTLPLVVLGGATLLIMRKFRSFLGYATLFLLAISPWIMFDLHNYGALVGSKEHLQVVAKTIDTNFRPSLVQLLSLSHEIARGFLLSFQPDFLFDHASSSVRILSTVWSLFIYVSGISLICKVVADLRRRRR